MQRTIHQIWVGPYRMPTRERRLVEGMQSTNPTWKHVLWTDSNLPTMPDHIRERFDHRMAEQEYAFAADVLRPFVVHEFGGMYFDVDTECLHPIDTLHFHEWSGVFVHHGPADPTMPNGYFGLSAGHPLGAHLCDLLKTPAYEFGPHWLGYSVREFLGLDKEASHEATAWAMRGHNMLHISSQLLYKAFRDYALFSWSKENKERFKSGDYA